MVVEYGPRSFRDQSYYHRIEQNITDVIIFCLCRAPCRLVVSVQNLKTEGSWFDPGFLLYSIRRLMIIFATGFIPLSPIVSTMVMWDRSQSLGDNIVMSTCKKELSEKMERYTGCPDITEIMLITVLNTTRSPSQLFFLCMAHLRICALYVI